MTDIQGKISLFQGRFQKVALYLNISPLEAKICITKANVIIQPFTTI